MSSFIAIDSAVPESKILEEVCGHVRHLGHLSRIMFKHIMSKHWYLALIGQLLKVKGKQLQMIEP